MLPHARYGYLQYVEALSIAGDVTTWIVRTMIQDNDTPIVFLQAIDSEGQLRVVLPAKVVKAIIRQEANLRARVTDRRSEERKERDSERARVQAAKALLERKRQERRDRRAGPTIDRGITG